MIWYILLYIIITLYKLSYQSINEIFTDSNLKFYLDCNRSIADSSSLHNIILSNMVSFENDRNSISNNACSFYSNLSNYLTMTTSNLPNLNNMLISFWMKPRTLPTEEVSLFYFTSLTNSLMISLTSNELAVKSNSGTPIITSKSSSINEQTWTFISFAFSQSSISLSINGNHILTSNTITLPAFASIITLYIGASKKGNASVDNFFSGALDEITIFDTSTISLTYENITSLYNYFTCNPLSQLSDNRKCINCNELFQNCEVCYNNTICDTCKQGFYLNMNTSLCECSRDNCEECDDEGNCKNCTKGFQFNDKGNCEANDCSSIDYCIRCENQTCFECTKDYEVKNGKCSLYSKAITGVVIVYLLVIIIIWIIMVVVIRPKLI